MTEKKKRKMIEVALIVAGFLIVVALGNAWGMLFGSLAAMVWLFVVRRQSDRSNGVLESRNLLTTTICAAVVAVLTVFFINLV